LLIDFNPSEDGLDTCLNCGEMIGWTLQSCPHCELTAVQIREKLEKEGK